MLFVGRSESEEGTTRSVMFAALALCVATAKHLVTYGNEAAALAMTLEAAMSATIESPTKSSPKGENDMR